MNVGIFFRVSGEFLIDAVPVGAAEPYGDALQYSGHYDYHEALLPETTVGYRFKAHAYDYYPRGRVVYFPKSDQFTLYIDPCLTQKEISRLLTLFGLEGQQVNIATDEHYHCAGCNKLYME
jgi:hypothetical protein